MSGNSKYIGWETVAEFIRSYRCSTDVAIHMEQHLNEIPAADVRPVKRGKWEDVRVRDYSTNVNGGMELHIASMFCPVCGRWHNEVYHYGNPTEMAHFCSNCGADMREEN